MEVSTILSDFSVLPIQGRSKVAIACGPLQQVSGQNSEAPSESTGIANGFALPHSGVFAHWGELRRPSAPQTHRGNVRAASELKIHQDDSMRMLPGPATSRPSGGDQTPDAPLECWSCPRKDNNKNQPGDSQMLTGSHHSNFRFAGDLSGPPESASEALNSRIGDLSRIDSRFRLPQPPGSTLFGRSVCTLWLLPGTLVSAAPIRVAHPAPHSPLGMLSISAAMVGLSSATVPRFDQSRPMVLRLRPKL